MTFSFHRGSLSLDFVGTVGERGGDPVERLPDADALRLWFAEAGLGADLRVDDGDLRDARALRDALEDVFSDAIDGKRVDGEALARLNVAAEGLRLGAPQLDTRFRVRWVTNAPIALAFARIAGDAIEVLSHERDRLTRCARDECGAILLSHSRSERRKWCSMEVCGNRAKVAAYRARAKARQRR